MKKMDIFCASQSATAICLSTIEISPSSTPSSSSAAAFLLTAGGDSVVDRGGAVIDRHNPIIRDPKRIPKSVPPRTDFSPPPKSRKTHHNKKNGNISLKGNKDEGFNGGGCIKRSWKCTNPGDFFSPPGSSRYLLSEKVFSSEFDSFGGKKLSVEEISKDVKEETEEFLFEEKAPSSSTSHSPEQVVVLRVSLHCRGCERKLSKHLSKMEGVKSYNIEFAAKKVTVTGNVTPLGVVASISKVKNAQLWSPTQL